MADLRQPDKPEDSERRPPAASLAAGHEVRDLKLRPIVWAGAGLIVLAVVVHVAMLVMLNLLASRESKQSAPASPLAGAYGLKAPPQPRLQTEPLGDLGQLHAAENAALDGYGWVDKQAGIVRIPIERAMELTAQAAPPASAQGAAQPAPGAPASGSMQGQAMQAGQGGPRDSGGSGDPRTERVPHPGSVGGLGPQERGQPGGEPKPGGRGGDPGHGGSE